MSDMRMFIDFLNFVTQFAEIGTVTMAKKNLCKLLSSGIRNDQIRSSVDTVLLLGQAPLHMLNKICRRPRMPHLCSRVHLSCVFARRERACSCWIISD